jgi:hypothetical protein
VWSRTQVLTHAVEAAITRLPPAKLEPGAADHDPELARYLRIEEREREAGGLD